MKGAVLSWLLIVLVFSANAQTLVTLHGQIVGYKNSTVYLYSARGLRQPAQLVDSVKLTSEFFTFKITTQEPKGYYLSLNELAGQLYFIWDKNIVVVINPDNIEKSEIEGSPTTESWRSFVENVEGPYEQKLKENRKDLYAAQAQKDTAQVMRLSQEGYNLFINHQGAIAEYIQTHHDSWIGLYMLASFFKDLGQSAAQKMLASLSPALQQSELGRQIKTILTKPEYPLRP
jgi:hypothetical protein